MRIRIIYPFRFYTQLRTGETIHEDVEGYLTFQSCKLWSYAEIYPLAEWQMLIFFPCNVQYIWIFKYPRITVCWTYYCWYLRARFLLSSGNQRILIDIFCGLLHWRIVSQEFLNCNFKEWSIVPEHIHLIHVFRKGKKTIPYEVRCCFVTMPGSVNNDAWEGTVKPSGSGKG